MWQHRKPAVVGIFESRLLFHFQTTLHKFTKNGMFTITVNSPLPVNNKPDLAVGRVAFNRLGNVLERIPGFTPWRADRQSPLPGNPDGWFEFRVGRKEYRVQFKLLANGYPKQVKLAISDLKLSPGKGPSPETYTVLVAPWFSPETVKLAAEHGYGTLDLSGNYRLHFGSIFMERVGEAPPASERRQAVSLFAPKSARILRALLAVPNTNWKVGELVALAGVSQGLVSRVRTALLERGWAEEYPDGISISEFEPLLQAWAQHFQKAGDQPWYGYTLHHGKRLNEAVQTLMTKEDIDRNVLLAGSSAAQWLAPYLRDERQYFQVTPQGFDRLYDVLDLESEPSGNVVIRKTDDEGAFLDRIQVAQGYWLTSPVQMFLDLHLQGERGEEAAEHLLQHYLKPRLEGRLPMPESPLRQQLASYRGQS